MLSGESKHRANESSTSQGAGSEGGDAGMEGGGVIFGATGEKNHKWLDAKSTPPSK